MDISTINVLCDECRHEGVLNTRGELVEDTSIDLANIHRLYKKLKCSRCKKKRPSVWSTDRVLLIDANNVTPCTYCELPIIQPRLDAAPETTTCVVCAE